MGVGKALKGTAFWVGKLAGKAYQKQCAGGALVHNGWKASHEPKNTAILP